NPKTGKYLKEGQPYTPVNPQKVGTEKEPTPKTPRLPEMMRVPKADGSGTEAKLLTPPSVPGGSWTDQQGNAVPAPLSKVAPTDPDWPGAPQLRGDPAFIYVSERERLGQHMSTTW